MEKNRSHEYPAATTAAEGGQVLHPWDFLRTALGLAQREAPFADFLREVCLELSEHHGFDSTEIWVRAHGKEIGCACAGNSDGEGRSRVLVSLEDFDSAIRHVRQWYERVRQGEAIPDAFRAASGAVWANISPGTPGSLDENPQELSEYGLVILLPFREQSEDGGLLVLRDRRFHDLDGLTVSRLELLAESLGIAVGVKKTQVALAERIKELTCLYKIALLAEAPGASLEDLLKGVVGLLPDAYLYPEDAWALIELEGVHYGLVPPEDGGVSLKADISVLGVPCGSVQVGYRTPKPTLDQGPFLREEKSLLDTVAREIALLVERKQREVESRALEEQLHHADRLVTIGELAAGVAHELNEPLANILGFAQLAGKGARLPKQTRGDIDKIVQAALHARELTQQLLFFARRMPQNRARIDLNAVVREALRLLEPLFQRERVDVVRQWSPSSLLVNADNGQIRQVVVNLVVNAVQAMPKGGRIAVSTAADQDQGTATLTIEDTGIGMSDDVVSKIFLPFFTTKEAGRGTGLGLAVVHGIVTSHGGRIEVHSRPNLGSRFDVFLPLCPIADNKLE